MVSLVASWLRSRDSSAGVELFTSTSGDEPTGTPLIWIFASPLSPAGRPSRTMRSYAVCVLLAVCEMVSVKFSVCPRSTAESSTVLMICSSGSPMVLIVVSLLGGTPVPVAVAVFVKVAPLVLPTTSSTRALNVTVTVFPAPFGFTTEPRLTVTFCPTTETLVASLTYPFAWPETATEPATNESPAGSVSAICTLFVVPSKTVSTSV